MIFIFNFLQLEVEHNVAGNLEFAAIYNSILYVSGFFLLTVTWRYAKSTRPFDSC